MAQLIEGKEKRYFMNLLFSEKTIKVQLLFTYFWSISLDTASILGGNEVAVAILLNEQYKKDYNADDLSVVSWALRTIWSEELAEDYISKTKIINQKTFTTLLPPLIQKDLASKLKKPLTYSCYFM